MMGGALMGWLPAPWRVKAVFQCFFDDSGKESEPTNPIVVMAGYIAVDEIWQRFQNLWGHLLLKHELPDVHMKAILQIPTHSGQVFRIDAGRDSDLMPATVPN